MRSDVAIGVSKTALLQRFASSLRHGAGAVAVLALLATGAPALAQPSGVQLIQADVFVRLGPPPLRREVIPPRPGARYVWQPGHWWWRGSRWVWGGGRWVIGPRVGAAWVPGHWIHRGARGWVWLGGHWR